MAIVEVKNTVTHKSLIKSLKDTDPVHHSEIIADFIDAFGVDSIVEVMKRSAVNKLSFSLEDSDNESK